MLRLLVILALLASGIQAGEYATERADGIRFERYQTTPAAIQLFWLGADGKPLRRFHKVRSLIEDRGDQPLMITNAGIFEGNRVPTGLHIESGKTLRPLNRKPGKGNFFLMPNGVFGITTDDKAFVMTTSQFAKTAPKCRLATQSGPILLVDGKIHPAFNANSKHRRHRNGVGILPNGQVLFIATAKNQEKYVTLYEFASLFKRHGCRDALFLDGDLSAMVVDFSSPTKVLNEYAAILAVVTPQSHRPAAIDRAIEWLATQNWQKDHSLVSLGVLNFVAANKLLLDKRHGKLMQDAVKALSSQEDAPSLSARFVDLALAESYNATQIPFISERLRHRVNKAWESRPPDAVLAEWQLQNQPYQLWNLVALAAVARISDHQSLVYRQAHAIAGQLHRPSEQVDPVNAAIVNLAFGHPLSLDLRHQLELKTNTATAKLNAGTLPPLHDALLLAMATRLQTQEPFRIFHETLLSALLAAQRPNGSWRLPVGHPSWDQPQRQSLSATMLATLILQLPDRRLSIFNPATPIASPKAVEAELAQLRDLQNQAAVENRQKIQEQLAELRERAAAGDHDASTTLGMQYFYGTVVEQDFNEAARYFLPAARHGHKIAKACTLTIHLLHRPNTLEPEMAKRWLTELKDESAPQYRTIRAYCLEHGKILKQDHAKAYSLYLGLARDGDEGGLVGVARFHEHGLHQPVDLVKAYAWYAAAANAGSFSALVGQDRIKQQLSDQEHLEARRLTTEIIEDLGTETTPAPME